MIAATAARGRVTIAPFAPWTVSVSPPAECAEARQGRHVEDAALAGNERAQRREDLLGCPKSLERVGELAVEDAEGGMAAPERREQLRAPFEIETAARLRASSQ